MNYRLPTKQFLNFQSLSFSTNRLLNLNSLNVLKNFSSSMIALSTIFCSPISINLIFLALKRNINPVISNSSGVGLYNSININN